MGYMKWCVVMVCAIVLGISTLSNAFEIQLAQEQVNEATEYGKSHKGKDIFYSNTVKEACFGKYPDGEGGLIMSKYIRIAVVSAMLAMKDKVLTPEDIKEIVASPTFDVIVNVSDESVQNPADVQIVLMQGTDNILPLKTEFGMKRKDKIQSVVGSFQYDRVNPRANATIVVKTQKDQRKYKIDFSHVK